MKKSLLIIGICILLIGMPAIAAVSDSSTIVRNNRANILKIINKEDMSTTPITDDPPEWANGNFSGLWGLDIWGEWYIPIGWMLGYYKRTPKLGYFHAGFASFWEENISWYIQGYFFGPFMFGSIGENEYANETIFVGIGRYNETNYHWRLMGEVGPTFFIRGTYTKFE
jgi:hypothetical protein